MAARGRRPVKIHLNDVLALMDKGANQSEVARQLGCTPAYIGHLLRKSGVETSGSQGQNIHARANAQKVLDHIVNNGGTLREALLSLDLQVCDATVRDLAKEHGIKIADYRYFMQRRRNWFVYKPGFRKGDSIFNVLPVECTECGHQMELDFMAFTKAKPCACPNCGAS